MAKAGTLLNQAAAAMNSDVDVDPRRLHAIADLVRSRVERLDDHVESVMRMLP